jgi:hypothetical protein
MRTSAIYFIFTAFSHVLTRAFRESQAAEPSPTRYSLNTIIELALGATRPYRCRSVD